MRWAKLNPGDRGDDTRTNDSPCTLFGSFIPRVWALISIWNFSYLLTTFTLYWLFFFFLFFKLLASYWQHELWFLETCQWPPSTWSLNALARDITVAAAVSGGADESDLLPLHRFFPIWDLKRWSRSHKAVPLSGGSLPVWRMDRGQLSSCWKLTSRAQNGTSICKLFS